MQRRGAHIWLLCLWLFLLTPAQADGGRILQLLWSPDASAVAALYALQDGTQLLEVRRHGVVVWQRSWPTTACRITGWSPGGQRLILEFGGSSFEEVGEKHRRFFSVPEDHFGIASNGQATFALDPLTNELFLRSSAVAALPPGVRTCGELSPQGEALALRRARRTPEGWSTEIWVYRNGQLKNWGSLPAGLVSLSWSPEGDRLLTNHLGTEGWEVGILDGQQHRSLAQGLKHPAQWDRNGRLYAADEVGLYTLPAAPDSRRYLARWIEQPLLWAVSPRGDEVVYATRGEFPLVLSWVEGQK